ncbi:hypothetical protein SNEBB_001814 [Seison nebaliae]|nr:hypothetical protein SNEBB_001814 [Seison nebaliae]
MNSFLILLLYLFLINISEGVKVKKMTMVYAQNVLLASRGLCKWERAYDNRNPRFVDIAKHGLTIDGELNRRLSSVEPLQIPKFLIGPEGITIYNVVLRDAALYKCTYYDGRSQIYDADVLDTKLNFGYVYGKLFYKINNKEVSLREWHKQKHEEHHHEGYLIVDPPKYLGPISVTLYDHKDVKLACDGVRSEAHLVYYWLNANNPLNFNSNIRWSNAQLDLYFAISPIVGSMILGKTKTPYFSPFRAAYTKNPHFHYRLTARRWLSLVQRYQCPANVPRAVQKHYFDNLNELLFKSFQQQNPKLSPKQNYFHDIPSTNAAMSGTYLCMTLPIDDHHHHATHDTPTRYEKSAYIAEIEIFFGRPFMKKKSLRPPILKNLETMKKKSTDLNVTKDLGTDYDDGRVSRTCNYFRSMAYKLFDSQFLPYLFDTDEKDIIGMLVNEKRMNSYYETNDLRPGIRNLLVRADFNRSKVICTNHWYTRAQFSHFCGMFTDAGIPRPKYDNKWINVKRRLMYKRLFFAPDPKAGETTYPSYLGEGVQVPVVEHDSLKEPAVKRIECREKIDMAFYPCFLYIFQPRNRYMTRLKSGLRKFQIPIKKYKDNIYVLDSKYIRNVRTMYIPRHRTIFEMSFLTPDTYNVYHPISLHVPIGRFIELNCKHFMCTRRTKFLHPGLYCKYLWRLNGKILETQIDHIVINHALPKHSGTYTCTVNPRLKSRKTQVLKLKVVDLIPPIFTMCPHNLIFCYANRSDRYFHESVEIKLPNPRAIDNVDHRNVKITCNKLGILRFYQGRFIVSCNATDKSGNVATCTYYIVVCSLVQAKAIDPFFQLTRTLTVAATYLFAAIMLIMSYCIALIDFTKHRPKKMNPNLLKKFVRLEHLSRMDEEKR